MAAVSGDKHTLTTANLVLDFDGLVTMPSGQIPAPFSQYHSAMLSALYGKEVLKLSLSTLPGGLITKDELQHPAIPKSGKEPDANIVVTTEAVFMPVKNLPNYII